jgi:cytochrome c-type biogenesis protein CcmE
MPMHPQRKRRLVLVATLVAGVGLSTALVLAALRENFNFFYAPDLIVTGEAPIERRIRAGGMVLPGSVRRSSESLAVEFVITDYEGHEFPVAYEGILPDLFREGQGVIVQGVLDAQRRFRADEVLAKHDENYMPPELAGMRETPAEGS